VDGAAQGCQCPGYRHDPAQHFGAPLPAAVTGRLITPSAIPASRNTAQLVVPDGGAQGVIIAQGGLLGGWSIYAKDGRPAYCYNLLGLQRFKIEGDTQIPAGEHQVRMEFAYDGGGLAQGGTVSLYIDGQKTGEGRVDRTEPMVFSLDDKTDVGSDRCTPISDDYGTGDSDFSGRIDWIQIDLGADAQNADHLISAEERFRIKVALQ
jgi:hypothetical protein